MPSSPFPASWIAPADQDNKPNATFRAYRSFSLEDVPAQALLQVSAQALCRVFLNGQEVLNGPSRGTAALQFRESVPVAPFLRKGLNHLAAIVHSPVTENFLAPPGEPALWVELEGILGTDAQWRLQQAPEIRREVPFHTFQTGYMEWRDLTQAPGDAWLLGELPGEWLPPRVLPPTHPLSRKLLLETGLPPQHRESIPPPASPGPPPNRARASRGGGPFPRTPGQRPPPVPAPGRTPPPPGIPVLLHPHPGSPPPP